MEHKVIVTIEKNDEVVGGLELLSPDEPNNKLVAELMIMHLETFRDGLINAGVGFSTDKDGLNDMVKKAMFNGFKKSRDNH